MSQDLSQGPKPEAFVPHALQSRHRGGRWQEERSCALDPDAIPIQTGSVRHHNTPGVFVTD